MGKTDMKPVQITITEVKATHKITHVMGLVSWE